MPKLDLYSMTHLISILCCNLWRFCGNYRRKNQLIWLITLNRLKPQHSAYFKIFTSNLLKLFHTGSDNRSVVFTDADKSKNKTKLCYTLAILSNVHATFTSLTPILLSFLVLAGKFFSNCLQPNKDVMRLIEKFA